METAKANEIKKHRKKKLINKGSQQKKNGKNKSNIIKTGIQLNSDQDGIDKDLQDLMTEEDKNILDGVKDREDESILDIKEDGKDIPLSEISGFLKQLNIAKYRPPDLTRSDVSNDSQNPNSNNRNQGGDEKNTAAAVKEAERSHGSTSSGFTREKQAKENVKKVKAATKFLSNVKSRKHLLLKPEDMWREEKLHPLPPHPPDGKLLHEAEMLAQRLVQDELSIYSRFRENTKRSEARWMKTVLASGTLSDKMAALTLLVQESPLHNMSSLESLVAMAGKKGKREAMMAVDTLRDLFMTGLLPDNRKLRAFNQQPWLELESLSEGNVDARDKLVMMWHYESSVKKKYAEFIKSLGDLSFDTLQATKDKAVSTIHQLLSAKPEQETILLSMLVNKLGDPAVKSKATYLLTKLVDEHPNMKAVIVSEVQQLLHRPNISPRAQYYAICFLVQLRLMKTDGDLASQLIKIYFYFFQTYLKNGEVANKMMSALLTGVNRAYVYATANKEELVGQMDEVYKIIPSVNFHTSVQALMLLFQVINASTNAADRYYACLYRKLADPALKNSSKQSIFMNLIFKSLKRDIVDRRIKAFLKRILQVYSQKPPQVICGILIILSQILGEKPGLLEVKHISEGAWSDDEEEKFVDQPVPEDFEDSAALSQEGPTSDTRSDEKPDPDDLGRQPSASDKVNGVRGSWVHRVNFGGAGRSSSYDPFSRNPLYSRAELDCVWELQQLARHYHPSVRLYAETLLKGQPIKYDGDPLKDFTLIRFLDRFVYKNPKKDLANGHKMKKFKSSAPTGIRAVPVNSKEFLEAGDEGVPVDEKFFLQYFVERAKRKGDDTSDVDSDADSVKDEEFDALLDGMEKDDDLGDLDLDFAGDKKKTQTSKKGGAAAGGHDDDDVSEDDEEEEHDDDDDDLDMEDDDLAAEFQKELDGLQDSSDDGDNDGSIRKAANSQTGKGFREEDIEFSPDEDDELALMMMGGPKAKKRKRGLDEEEDFMDHDDDDVAETSKQKKNKKSKKNVENLFASAEEFSHLLEEDTESGAVSLGGAADFRNKDKAAQKQLKWEGDRDRWLKGNKGRAPKHSGWKGKGKGGRQPKGGFGNKAHRGKPSHGKGKSRKAH